MVKQLDFKRILFWISFAICCNVWAADVAKVVFVAGDASIAGRQARLGEHVQEGRLLETGKDGYLYLETVDRGFLILRPSTKASIVAYKVDSVVPSNSKFKLELESGIARHISGEAAKAARQSFRFNTPVAAIGIRGTDFTIYTDQQTTRVSVLSGGVVVSPLSSSCLSSGFGPCEGSNSRELFAGKLAQVIQVQRGGSAPVFLQGLEQAPDTMSPPKSNEPSPSAANAGGGGASKANAGDTDLSPLKVGQLDRLTKPTMLVWGRWQALLDQPIEVDVAALQSSNNLVATNSYFALMRNRDTVWVPPGQASMEFAMQQSQVVISNDLTRQVIPAKLENGLLQLNFANSSFFTKFDLVNQSERIGLQNSGQVSADGKLFGGAQFFGGNNMAVMGSLAADSRTAAYLFQSRLDSQRLSSGVVSWGK